MQWRVMKCQQLLARSLMRYLYVNQRRQGSIDDA